MTNPVITEIQQAIEDMQALLAEHQSEDGEPRGLDAIARSIGMDTQTLILVAAEMADTKPVGRLMDNLAAFVIGVQYGRRRG